MDDSVYERGYPHGAILRLQSLIDEIHPALPISIGRWDDRSSWIYHAEPDPDLDAIFAAFDPWSPATGGVFDSGPALEEVREAYGDSHTDNEGAGDVGLAEHSGADLGGDGGEHVEAPEDDPAGGDPDFSAEPVGDDSALGESGAYPGVMMVGDPLKAAKNDAREELARKQRSILDQYPWQDNLREFDLMQGVRWAIAEGTHPPFNDEQQAEFDALSTFASWFGRVNQNAFNITVQIDDAETVEAVQAIDIHSGWPE